MVRKSRRQSGQSLVEMIVGSIMLVSIGLFGIDLGAVVLANTANDSLAKNAARAAANQVSRPEAAAAARRCVTGFRTSSVIVSVALSDDMVYEAQQHVVVKTTMTVKLPAAIPGIETVRFEAQAAEPLVASPADV